MSYQLFGGSVMAIITISRQNGSLGDEIASGLATRLGTEVISRQYALDNFYGEINPGTLDRLNESAKFFQTALPGSQRTYADILVERIRTMASASSDSNLIVLGLGGCMILSDTPVQSISELPQAKRHAYVRLPGATE